MIHMHHAYQTAQIQYRETPISMIAESSIINSSLITVQLWHSHSCLWIHLVNHSYKANKALQSHILKNPSPKSKGNFAFCIYPYAIYQNFLITMPFPDRVDPFLHSFFSNPFSPQTRHPQHVFRVFCIVCR